MRNLDQKSQILFLDFITNDQLSLHVLGYILDNIDMAREITDDKTILFSMINLSYNNEQISNLISSGLASLGEEGNKSERSFISPHFGMRWVFDWFGKI